MPASLSSGRMPDGRCSNKLVTSVPPSLSSNVTTMVTSPEKADPLSQRLSLGRFLWGRELHEPFCETVFPLRGFAAVRVPGELMLWQVLSEM